MKEIAKKKSPAAEGSAAKSGENNSDDLLELRITSANAANENELTSESLLVIEDIASLLSSEDLITAVKKYKADTGEKEIAVEFANSHTQFLTQIVESDYKKGVSRTDVEVRDVVSNVNTMLKKRNEYLFTTIIMHSPQHYRNIQKKYYAKIKKQDEGKGKKN